MADQVPYAAGLEEVVEQQMVIWLENLCTRFTGQQADGTQPIVKIASLYNKLQIPAYPFIGIRAFMPTWEPSFLADYESVDPTTGFPMYSKINEVLINLHLESKEYRQIQRLYSFLQLQLEFSWDPLHNPQPEGGYESWLSQMRNWGLVINGWKANPVIPVTQTDTPDSSERSTFPRSDVYTLFERDINMEGTVQTRVLLSPTQEIMEIDQNLTIILPAP